MKGRVAVVGEIDGVAVAALIADGRLEDLLIDHPQADTPAPGAIFRGICDRPLKGQGGMILRLPDGKAFLRGAKGLREGQAVLVQVTGYPEAGKAIPVTDRILHKGRTVIVTPGAPGINVSRSIKDEDVRVRLLEVAHQEFQGPEGSGLIVRSLAATANDDEVATEIHSLSDLATKIQNDAEGRTPELLLDGPDAHLLAWRDWGDVDQVAEGDNALEDFDVYGAVGAMRDIRFNVAGGGYCFIERTRAMVTVDVNTGKDTSLAAGLKANIATARDLPRQLRCRGLGGQITVDFAPMPKKDRRQLEQVLKAAFRADSIDTALAGWTPLGNFELQRKRERLPL